MARKTNASKFLQWALDIERRLAKTATLASIEALDAKLDRQLALLERAIADGSDVRRTLTVFDAALGTQRRALEGHARRLDSLEARRGPA